MTEHASDCAVHNAPALPKGECDCRGEPLPWVLERGAPGKPVPQYLGVIHRQLAFTSHAELALRFADRPSVMMMLIALSNPPFDGARALNGTERPAEISG